MKTTIAIDNGVTGSIAIIGPDGVFFEPVPTKEQLMGKAGKVVRRIDHQELYAMIGNRMGDRSSANWTPLSCRAYVERPFTGGPMMVNVACLSARAHEAVSITLESLQIGYETVDSKNWQLACLGQIKGSDKLKRASKLRGIQMFPQYGEAIQSHGDADSLLMAQYYHNQST